MRDENWFDICVAIIAYFIKHSRNDDDFADRLNHRFTPFILVIFATYLSFWKLGGMSMLLLTWSHK